MPTYAVDHILKLGDKIQIESGLLEIEFRDGAVVVLKGPAHLVAVAGNRAELFSGQLAAFAPPWAKGFRVDTPGLGVIDHGTRFAVRVDTTAAKPAVDVLVAEGEVEILEGSEATEGRRLFAGQGVRSDGRELNQDNDDNVMDLVAELPKELKGRDVVVAGDRWRDWQPGESGQPNRKGPWRYFTNVDGPFGEPSFYQELLWKSGGIGCFAPLAQTLSSRMNRSGSSKCAETGGTRGEERAKRQMGWTIMPLRDLSSLKMASTVLRRVGLSDQSRSVGILIMCST